MAKAFEYAIDIDTVYYEAIGEIAARWSWLEHRLTVLIREGFLFDKAAARAVMASMNAVTLVRTARTLTAFPDWIKSDPMRAEVAAFVEAVEAQRAKRNDYVHGVYGPESAKPGTIYRILMRRGDQILEPKGTAVTIAQLKAFARELRELQVSGNTLSDKLKKAQRK